MWNILEANWKTTLTATKIQKHVLAGSPGKCKCTIASFQTTLPDIIWAMTHNSTNIYVWDCSPGYPYTFLYAKNVWNIWKANGKTTLTAKHKYWKYPRKGGNAWLSPIPYVSYQGIATLYEGYQQVLEITQK